MRTGEVAPCDPDCQVDRETKQDKTGSEAEPVDPSSEEYRSPPADLYYPGLCRSSDSNLPAIGGQVEVDSKRDPGNGGECSPSAEGEREVCTEDPGSEVREAYPECPLGSAVTESYVEGDPSWCVTESVGEAASEPGLKEEGEGEGPQDLSPSSALDHVPDDGRAVRGGDRRSQQESRGTIGGDTDGERAMHPGCSRSSSRIPQWGERSIRHSGVGRSPPQGARVDLIGLKGNGGPREEDDQ